MVKREEISTELDCRRRDGITNFDFTQSHSFKEMQAEISRLSFMCRSKLPGQKKEISTNLVRRSYRGPDCLLGLPHQRACQNPVSPATVNVTATGVPKSFRG